MPSTCFCRRPNANAVATRDAALTPRLWRQAHRSTAAHRAAPPRSTRSRHCLNRPVLALDPDLQPMDASAVALIDESRCIGCALCLPACPVDAISGAAGHMHTVIARHCTGCELCIPACPVDCIAMVADASRAIASTPPSATEMDPSRADDSRRRYDAHRKRAAARVLAAEERRQERQSRLAARRSWDDQ